MRRHIVGSFQCVSVIFGILRYRIIEVALKIGPHIRGSILVYSQRSGRVADEYVCDSYGEIPYFHYIFLNFICYEMKPSFSRF